MSGPVILQMSNKCIKELGYSLRTLLKINIIEVHSKLGMGAMTFLKRLHENFVKALKKQISYSIWRHQTDQDFKEIYRRDIIIKFHKNDIFFHSPTF